MTIHNFFLFCFTLLYSIFPAHSEFLYVTFDQSMHFDTKYNKSNEYKFFENYYAERNPLVIKNCYHIKIPKIIHQIWIGPNHLPAEYLKLSKSWKKLHPNWQYKLWLNQDVEQWDFETKDLYNKASSYQEKADILRYEILKKYGGLYVDFDYEAIKSFEDFHDLYGFYSSIEPPFSSPSSITITNALIASTPENPIIIETLKKIREHWDTKENEIRNISHLAENNEFIIFLAVHRTMSPLMESIKNNMAKQCSIAFPPTYLSIESRGKWTDNFRNFFGDTSKRLAFRTIQPETYARQKRGHKRVISNLSDINLEKTYIEKLRIKFNKWKSLFFSS